MSWEVPIMRSRISFFNRTVFLHDLKRWWPLTALYTLLWLLILPFPQLTMLNHYPDQSVWDINHDALNVAAYGGYIVAFLTGILFAMAAFSYLTNPRATNGLHALSARRETLYVTHCLAGLVSQLVPQLVAVALTAAVIASHNALDLRVTGLMLSALVLPTLFFYLFGVFCMMFTGQILAAPVFYGVLNVLVVGVEMLVRAFAGNFLYGWSSDMVPVLTAFSPIIQLTDNGIRAIGSENVYYSDEFSSGVQMAGKLQLLGLEWLLVYAAAGLVFAALGLLVYRKRHSEATGTIVAVYWARPVFKYGVTFCAAMALGQLLYYLFFGQFRYSGSYSLSGTLGCMALAGLIGYFVAEMLLKKSFRVWKTGWRGAAVVVAVLVALGCALTFDFTGYERYVPDVEDIAVAGVSMHFGYDGNIYLNGITDPETIRAITDAHRAVTNDKARQLRLSESGEIWSYDDETAVTGYFSVDYYLKDGRLVRRNYSEVTVFAGEQGDPASTVGAITALNNSETGMLARKLGRWSFNGSKNPRTLPDLRFAGGDVYMYHGTAGNDWEESRSLTAHEAELIYQALLRDVAAGHATASLFRSEPTMSGNLTLYATYAADRTTDREVTHPSDLPPERESVTYEPELTERMTETLATLRAMGVEALFDEGNTA